MSALQANTRHRSLLVVCVSAAGPPLVIVTEWGRFRTCSSSLFVTALRPTTRWLTIDLIRMSVSCRFVRQQYSLKQLKTHQKVC